VAGSLSISPFDSYQDEMRLVLSSVAAGVPAAFEGAPIFPAFLSPAWLTIDRKNKHAIRR
jgi:hypothetical protein